jgi:hypothetical protein
MKKKGKTIFSLDLDDDLHHWLFATSKAWEARYGERSSKGAILRRILREYRKEFESDYLKDKDNDSLSDKSKDSA